MATYTWSIPVGNQITGSTKVKDTDNFLANTVDDLVDFVNGEGTHSGQGLTYDLVDKASSQTLTGQKTFSSAIIASGGVTGNVTGTVTGNITGNSATATKLASARTISISGGISGSVSFDGSANAEIVATVVDDSHSHIISNVDGLQTLLNTKQDITTAVTTTSSQALSNSSPLSISGSVVSLNKADGTSNSITIPSPSFTVSLVSLSFGNDNTINIPSGAISLQGTCYHYMGGNNGSRLSAQFKNSSGIILQTIDLTGGNEGYGTDGGSGMSTRSAFTCFIPSTATQVRLYRSSGSNTMSGYINQFLIYG